ncbi:uncharacterized protein F5147DRAFT_656200 [Suillus discolor]|uniref:DUF6532 domain-containing protein n=1 Tax=Suillus discolor TaxID=1912936 RepID=A0A9P7JQ69_9AGAM|nr:uncharacterized protein F5147DRAFT_656200 [Suillus discolor]KAG2097959.1 hypothetical protein F5147DRAFT_656200 [Suillus discolor]
MVVCADHHHKSLYGVTPACDSGVFICPLDSHKRNSSNVVLQREYCTKEQQEHDGHRQGLLQKTKTSRKNREPHSSDGSQFTAENVPLASATVNPLSLKPRFTKMLMGVYETTYMDQNVSDDEYSHKDVGRYLSSSNNECNMPLNRKWKCNAEDLSEDSPSPQHHDQLFPCKICKSKGCVAARDYEVAVQQLIKFTIGDFCGWLASQYAYPDCMTQVSWVKEAWKEACVSLNIEIGFNSEIIQIITHHTLHLTSEVKAKLRPLVESIYRISLDYVTILVLKDLGDRKSKNPRSGLFRTRLNQKGANLIWYQNERDKGIMFDKQNAVLMNGLMASGPISVFQAEINNTGRKHAKVDLIEVVHGDYLYDHKIEHTVQEYMQGGNDRNESDAAEESDGDNEGKHE